MNRMAILIGSNFDAKIPGVKADIAAWRDFLCSPLGGAWNKDELVFLEDARKADEVIAAVKCAEKADYAFISFSGHGGIYKQRRNFLGLPETFICLGDNEFLSEYQLNPGKDCHRCTIILDCCRKTISTLSFLVKIASVQEASDNKIRQYFRDFFDREIEASDMGCVKIYATEIDNEAADQNSFSRILIESSKSYMASHGNYVLHLNDAVAIAKQEMDKINPQQCPQYLGGRRNHHFPFIVNPIING